MKLLVATGIYPPDIGGPATYSQLLRERMPARGTPVKILTFGEVRYLPKFIRHFVFFCKAVLKGYRCDIIYAQDPVSVGFPSLLAARLLRKKYYIRVAGDYAWEQAVQRYGIKDGIDEFQNRRYGFKTEYLKAIQKFVVGHADCVITPSKYFRDLVSGWNKKQKEVFHIYNGIEFPEDILEREEAREKLGMKDNEKVIVTAGRLVPWKGFKELIDVVGLLAKEYSGYKLYILGAGPDKEKLENKIKESGLSSNVIMTGAVSREKVFEYLSAADFFVLNTSFESFSFQIVEAMHAGAPLVSTNIGNISEIVDNNKDGILVTPNDIQTIADSIRKIDGDKDFAKSLVVNAKEKSKQFSIESTLDRLGELLAK